MTVYKSKSQLSNSHVSVGPSAAGRFPGFGCGMVLSGISLNDGVTGTFMLGKGNSGTLDRSLLLGLVGLTRGGSVADMVG